MQVSKRAQSLAAAAALALAATGFGGAALLPSAAAAPAKDCRTYSSTTACGEISLTSEQNTCVTRSVALGMTERRAEVECTQLP
ncbi:hypothetical protein [Actinocorallia populi]|uniref:hypothetical protein n=1 Tax=Actinocorallia populi TaxID=2079200 RepID=UPI000D08BB32|nr:hypothetical protein [Actinocorallia populi]